MGRVIKPIASMYGIGRSYGDYYQPNKKFHDFIDDPRFFGSGGLQDRLIEEEKRLSSDDAWKLNAQDMTSLGQAQGLIERQFGNEANQLTNQLRSRGLASAGSGASEVGFSGLSGNRLERLRAAQTDIADRRLASARERLQQSRANLMALRGQRLGELQAEESEKKQSLQDKRSQRNLTMGDAFAMGNFSMLANPQSTISAARGGSMQPTNSIQGGSNRSNLMSYQGGGGGGFQGSSFDNSMFGSGGSPYSNSGFTSKYGLMGK